MAPLLLLRETETQVVTELGLGPITSPNKIYCLAAWRKLSHHYQGKKSWAFITGSVDSECFLNTLLLLGRLRSQEVRAGSASANYNYSIKAQFAGSSLTA